MMSIKKRVLIVIIFILSVAWVFSDESNDNLSESISTHNIKIGQSIILSVDIKNMPDLKVLWENLTTTTDSTSDSIEIYSHDYSYKKDDLSLKIDFSLYNQGKHTGIGFTIPLQTKDSQIIYLKTNKYTITVKNPLTPQEIENLKKIKDPSKVELRPKMKQAKFKFHFPVSKSLVLIILGVLLVGVIIFLILFYIFKKKKKLFDKEASKLPPYQRFLYRMERTRFENNDDRKIIENKLSLLTEILKELLYSQFLFNATSETTAELIRNLRNISFREDIVSKINILFSEIDMIKFAKAETDYDRLLFFYNNIRELGSRINEIYKETQIEETNEVIDK